jgi:hypothetical protein
MMFLMVEPPLSGRIPANPLVEKDFKTPFPE